MIEKRKPGSLYIVAMPIGNERDITLRALDVLNNADIIVCEEYREGSTALKKQGIVDKQIILLNEHNEAEQTPELIKELFMGKNLALITDCGTPAFADPGALLIQECSNFGVRVIPVPGASSLTAAISLSPRPLNEFYFAGFLPKKDDSRRAHLVRLANLRVPIILMDTPYRLARLLQECATVFGKNRMATLAMDMTMPRESVLHATLGELVKQSGAKKAEFLLIVHI